MPDLVVTVDSVTKQLPEAVRTRLAADLPPGISSWDDLEDKPPVIAAGESEADARTAIGVDAATTSTSGLVELATTGETTTGTDTDRAVTPAGLKAVADTKITAADWGVIPTLYIADGVWPARTLPPGYTGPVCWDSLTDPEAPSPAAAVTGDRWLRHGSTEPPTPPPAEPEYVGSTKARTAGNATLTVAFPAGATTGDTAILFLDAMEYPTDASTLPAGWDLIARATGAQNIVSDCYAKTLGGGDTGSLIITLAKNNIRYSAHLVVYRDVDLAGIDDHYAMSGGSATVTTPAATAPAGAIVVEHVAQRGNPSGATWTVPSGVTGRQNSDHTYEGVDVRSATGDYVAETAGAVGSHEWVQTVSTNHQASWTIVLPPADA